MIPSRLSFAHILLERSLVTSRQALYKLYSIYNKPLCVVIFFQVVCDSGLQTMISMLLHTNNLTSFSSQSLTLLSRFDDGILMIMIVCNYYRNRYTLHTKILSSVSLIRDIQVSCRISYTN